MTNNWLGRVSLTVVLTAAGVWLWRASGDPVQVLAASALALTAVAGAFWQSRVASARRVGRILDAYVERTLARETGRELTKAPAAKASPTKPFTARVA